MRTHRPQNEYRAFFLVGPTAVGKTAVAHWIAEAHSAEGLLRHSSGCEGRTAKAGHQGFDILSADSMLVYRGMDIGTAKPTARQRAQVRYWGMDLISPAEPFSVADYRTMALQVLNTVASENRSLIVTGGTGLYIKSLTDGLASRPPRNEAIRSQAERLRAEQGIEALQEWLNRLDPARYQALPDKHNPRRLIRAIEMVTAGTTTDGRQWKSRETGPWIPGLMLPPAKLYASIEARVRVMYAGGLIEEVQSLLAQGFASAPTASQAIGYAEVIEYLNGRRTLEEARSKTIVRTRHLAKRQMTWFRHQANVDWLMVDDAMPIAERAQKVLEYWHSHGPTSIVGL